MVETIVNAIRKPARWILLGGVGGIALCSFIYAISLFTRNGGSVLNGLVELLVVQSLCAFAFIGLWLKKREIVTLSAMLLICYYVMMALLALGGLFDEIKQARENAFMPDGMKASLITADIFVMLGFLAYLAAVVLYVIPMFAPKAMRVRNVIYFVLAGAAVALMISYFCYIGYLSDTQANFGTHFYFINLRILVPAVIFVASVRLLDPAVGPAPAAEKVFEVEEAAEEKPAEEEAK